MASIQVNVPLGILSMLVLIANVFVLYLVFTNRNMRTPTNSFVVSLAISDICTGLVIFFQYLIGFQNNVIINVVYAVVLICGAANLTAVTADRYVAVTMPFSYHGLMTKYSKSIIAMTWFISVIIALLPLCWLGNISASYHKIYILLVVFLCIILPFLFILFANIKIFTIVRKCINKEQETLMRVAKNDNKERDRKARSNSMRYIFIEAKVAKVFVVAAITFVVTWFPVLYYSITAGLGYYDAIPNILIKISPFGIILGSLANPIIYSFMKPDFKNAIKTLIYQRKRFRKDLTVIYKPRYKKSSQSSGPTAITTANSVITKPTSPIPQSTVL